MKARRWAVVGLSCLLATWALAAPAAAEPTSEEVKAEIAALEAQYDELTAAYAESALSLETAQGQLDQTTAQLAQAEAKLAGIQTQVIQVALYRWQDHDLNQSIALFSSPDAATMMQRLSVVNQVNFQFDSLLEDYLFEQSNLQQLKAAQEANLQTIAERRTAMEQQMADIQAKTTEARNLLATVVSPRDVGDNTGLTAHAIQVKQTLAGVFTEITTIGGYRAGDWGDHGSGLALDVMIPDWSSESGIALGDTIARWCQDNAGVLGVKYLIWRQRYWQAGWGNDSWQWMADRGSPTQNHYDHVHISLTS
ncbi:MAG: hypothetical protein LBR33_05685 [Propionibacteriaceae bacterium]|nr:hypothetical protein [Propionibacteriaceae bacterium]